MDEKRGAWESGDGRIAWRRLGDGPPLLLINGYAATKDDWDPAFLAALGEHSTVLCPDNRGIGDSTPATGELSVASMAADAAGLLDGVGWERADVAGWSMGGFVAQQLAADAPDRIGGLALLATDAGGADAVHCPGEVFRRLIDHSGTPHEQAERLLGLLFPEALASSIYERFGDLVADARANLDPAALTAQEGAMSAWASGDNRARLAAIEAPVLAAAGSADQVIPAANAEILAGLHPDAWLARFPGCGHALMAQEPQRLARLIGAFLGR
jgi:pimeloyl-ACP methyl ester carboxylesterase